MEAEVLEKILLNFGEQSPLLLVIFLLIRFVWPDISEFLLKYLEARERASGRPDPVEEKLSDLSTGIAHLVATLNAFVGEFRVTFARGALAELSAIASQPPVSPAPTGDGGQSDESPGASNAGPPQV